MFTIIGKFLSGLGLFFTGIEILSNNLKQASGRRFRQIVARWTGKDWKSGLLGTLAGAIMQSNSAITYITVGIIRSGLISVRRALPIIAGANVGTATLVLMATLDIKLFMLYLLGIAGLCFAFDKPVKYRTLVGALLGIGLLFLGIFMIDEGSRSLQNYEWFKTVLLLTSKSYVFAFLIGVILTMIAQSSAAVSVVAITMASIGLFSIEQTMMIIYGTNVGSALISWIMSGGMKGTSRQIAMFSVFYDCFGGLIFLILFYVEIYLHVPLMKALIMSLPGSVQQQMAYSYLIYNLFTGIVLWKFFDKTGRVLEKFYPPTEEEDESKVKFIHDNALVFPESAMELVEKEQLRLANRFPKYMDNARCIVEKGTGDGVIESYHNAFSSVVNEIQNFLTDLVEQRTSSYSSERLLAIQNKQSILVSIEENLYNLVKTLDQSPCNPAARSLVQNFIEGLDTILLTAIDAVDNADNSTTELLKNITQDRGITMERIRSTYLSGESELDMQSKATLLYITNLFERIVWMLNRLSRLLETKENN